MSRNKISTEELTHARELLAKAKVEALARVKRSYTTLRDAEAAYGEAVMDADYVGLGPTEIAREIGVSETAVRMFIKRRREQQ